MRQAERCQRGYWRAVRWDGGDGAVTLCVSSGGCSEPKTPNCSAVTTCLCDELPVPHRVPGCRSPVDRCVSLLNEPESSPLVHSLLGIRQQTSIL